MSKSTIYRQLTEAEIAALPAEIAATPRGLVYGAVEDGRVVAALGAFTVVYLDPLWVAPDRRPFGGLRALWTAVKTRLAGDGITFAVGHAADERMVRALSSVGGIETPARRQFIIPTGAH